MATKPRAESVTMGGTTGSGVAAGGSPTTAGTKQSGAAKVMMPEVDWRFLWDNHGLF